MGTLLGYLILIMAIVSGCGKSVEDGPKKSTKKAVQNLSEFKADCVGNACDNQAVVNIQFNYHTVCTGFLVSKNVVMTTAHCLQEVTNTKACSKLKVFSKDPTKSSAMIESSCSEILHATKFNNSLYESSFFHPDYALFRINQELPNKPLEFKADGIENLKKYQVITTELSSLSKKITYKKQTCTARLNTMLNPESINAKGEVVVLSQCPLDATHLGAPIIRNDGSLAGIVTEVLSHDFNPTAGIASKSYLTKIIDEAGRLLIKNQQIAIGTNANCFNEIRAGIFASDNYQCERAVDNYFQQALLQAKKQNTADLKIFDSKIDQMINDKKIQWYYNPINDEVWPLCVKDHMALMAKMKEDRSYYDAWKGKLEVSYEQDIRSFSFQGVLNTDFQAYANLLVEKNNGHGYPSYQVKIDASTFDPTKKFLIVINAGTAYENSYKIGACGK